MRKVKNHDLGPVTLQIFADDRGPGNASHEYTVMCSTHSRMHQEVKFQRGGVPDHGVNGVTNEALLSIVADRLEGFQEGPFACTENQMALDRVLEAIDYLNARTLERQQRGVEGKELP